MKVRFIFIVCFAAVTAMSIMAQTKTVTNADLSKYSQERVKAEKDLCENYAKLGFSSPEELERRDKSDAKERAELSARLSQEQREREWAVAEIEQRRAEQSRYDSYIRSLFYDRPQQDNFSGVWFSGFGRFRSNWIPRAAGPAYRADGSGIVYEPGGRSSHIWTPVLGSGRRR